MCTSVDPSLFLLLNIDAADEWRRPCNTLECALSPDERKLAFAFVFLANTSYFSIREVLAFMDPYDAEGSLLLRVVLTEMDNRLTSYFARMDLRRCRAFGKMLHQYGPGNREVKGVESFALSGDVDRWKRLRDEIHMEVCEKGYDPERRTFTQYYGSQELDASLLMMPLVGFLSPEDGRMRGTVEAIERELCADGFVRRYQTETSRPVDGLPPGEGAFLPCSFWLADNYWLLGRHQDARQLFERLLALCNDVGLLSEEYDPRAKRLVGNFPQAFSHVSLINTAYNLSAGIGPAAHRKSA